MRYIVVIILILSLFGCGSNSSYNSAQEARDSAKVFAYTIDGMHYVIGAGEWIDNRNRFRIYDVHKQIWDVPKEVKIEREEVSREFINKQTK